ncbi:MAG: hypothetical protein M3R55_17020 [Acidobacteriota bacterium]|nr:hypothetical protein [Acidobacteriota bacterium]
MSTTTLGNAIGTGQVTALFGGDAAVFAQFESEARDTIVSVLQHAGYTAPTTLVADAVGTGFFTKIAHALIVRAAYPLRKGISVPESVGLLISDGIQMLNSINAKCPPPGMEPSALGGKGGSRFSPTTGTDGRPRGLALRGTSF